MDVPPPLASRPAHVDLALPTPVPVSANIYGLKQVAPNDTGISQQTDSHPPQQEVQLDKVEEEVQSPTLTQKLFPKSLLQDYYSDSESEEGDNDGSQPYSPSQVLVISTPTHERESSESPPTSTLASTPSVSTPRVVDSASPACLSNNGPSQDKEFSSASIASSLEMILGSAAKTTVTSHLPSSCEELNRFPISSSFPVSKDSVPSQPSFQGYKQFPSSQDAASGQQQLPLLMGPHPLPPSTTANISVSEEPKWFNPDAFAESRAPASHGFHPTPSENAVATTAPSQQPSSLAPPTSITVGISQADSRLSASPPPKSELSKINPENIKITPSLTSLLDNLFPKLSKSLVERKRKGKDDGNPDGVSKAPRMNSDGPAVDVKTSDSVDVRIPTLVSGSLAPSQPEPSSVHNAVASPIPTIGSQTPSRVGEFQRNSAPPGNFGFHRPIPSVPPLMPGFRPDLPSPGPTLGGPPPEFFPPGSGIQFPFRPNFPGPGVPQAQFSPGPRPDFGVVSLNNSPFPVKPFEPFPSPYSPGLDTMAMRPQNFNVMPPPPHLRFPGRFRSPSQRPRYF